MKSRPLFPSHAVFNRLRGQGIGVSFVVSRPCRETARTLFEPLVRTTRRPILLESSRSGGSTGRFSFFVSNPFQILRSKGSRWSLETEASSGRRRALRGFGDPLPILRKLVRKHRCKAGGPLPFAGGAAGLFAYEFKDRIERPSVRVRDPWGIPDLDLGFYDRGFALDHANRRLCAFRAFSPVELKKRSYTECLRETLEVYDALDRIRSARTGTAPPTAVSFAPPLVRRLGRPPLAQKRFMRAAERIREHIRKGDVYQVNLSQVIELVFGGDPYSLYLRQAEVNPTSFAAYADFGRYRLLSASPERLVRVEGNRVSTRPIAGTRPRSRDSRKDRRLTAELLLSPKERAEHVMLVDLERNDLGRVCRPGSVRVDELMAVEKYSHVKHIVSNVTGILRADQDAWDAIRAVFPGGTITGAPKIRAMELIGRLEGRVRGPYTGSLGYVGFDGNCDLNIVIRTLWTLGRKAYLQAGAGIVADSDPRKEYEETLHKAAAFLDVLGLPDARVA